MLLKYSSVFGGEQVSNIQNAVEDCCSVGNAEEGQLEALIAAQGESARIIGAVLQHLHDTGKADDAAILSIMGEGFNRHE